MSFTDHAMVQCNVILNLIKPKSAYWHFNTSLLSDTFLKIPLRLFGRITEKQNLLFGQYNSGGILARFRLNNSVSSTLTTSLESWDDL